MKQTRAALLLLVSALMIPAAIGCSGATDDGNDTQNAYGGGDAGAETEELDPIEARKLIPDNLPEANYDGYVFRIASNDDGTLELFSEAETGDVTSDAIYHRNQAVEERFNCQITVVIDEAYYNTSEWIRQQVSAGDDAMDLISLHVVANAQLAMNEMLLNLYDLPYLDFEQPWWAQSTTRDLTVNDRCYIAVGDLDLSAIKRTYCTFYNKTRGKAYDLPDMFEIVDSGKYTIDYLISVTKDIYTDLNGNNIPDNDDAFGYCTDSMSNLGTYLWAFDNPIFTRDGDGMKFAMVGEKLNNIVTTLCSAFNENTGVRQGGEGVWDYGVLQFAASKTIFANGTIGQAGSTFREMEDDYSILPYPKWDEAQEEYYTIADGSHKAQSVPVTVKDYEKLSVIIEALNAETYKQVTPVVYDNVIKLRGTRDDESIEMLDRIVASRRFDLGFVYDGWKGASFILEKLVRTNDPNFESYWAAHEASIMEWYGDVLNYFEEHE